MVLVGEMTTISAITCRNGKHIKKRWTPHYRRHRHRILSTGPYSLAYPLFCYR
jgi:hypothetical protein